jgi:predicted transcriptional regulator of viral defense system
METKRVAEKAEKVFRKHGGILRTAQALAEGIHPRTLYELRDQGRVLPLNRGLYRLADLPPLGNPDLATIAVCLPSAVICLVSALSFHGITTQIPHQVDIALPRGTKSPKLTFSPLRIFRFSPSTFEKGIETRTVDKVKVRIYSSARTVVDCFKFRNRIGIDVAVEALRLCRQRRVATIGEILTYARLLRMERVMTPYLEAMQ